MPPSIRQVLDELEDCDNVLEGTWQPALARSSRYFWGLRGPLIFSSRELRKHGTTTGNGHYGVGILSWQATNLSFLLAPTSHCSQKWGKLRKLYRKDGIFQTSWSHLTDWSAPRLHRWESLHKHSIVHWPQCTEGRQWSLWPGQEVARLHLSTPNIASMPDGHMGYGICDCTINHTRNIW